MPKSLSKQLPQRNLDAPELGTLAPVAHLYLNPRRMSGPELTKFRNMLLILEILRTDGSNTRYRTLIKTPLENGRGRQFINDLVSLGLVDVIDWGRRDTRSWISISKKGRTVLEMWKAISEYFMEETW